MSDVSHPLIEAIALRRSFAGKAAVDGLTLSVAAGEIYALVGPDGAGKTTTMRLLTGVLRCDAGQVRLAGIELARQPDEARAHIGYLPQRFGLYGDLTVDENLRFLAEVRGLRPRDWAPRSKEILDFVGLAPFRERRADALSGGMKQKLGLAAALVHQPRILLLDEPTSGVDPLTRQSFWQLLIRLLRQGVAVLISTPYMDEAARCTRVGFMSQGRILVEGSPSQVTQDLQGRVIELLTQADRRVIHWVRRDPQVRDARLFGDRLHVTVERGAAEAVIVRLGDMLAMEGVHVASARVIPAGMEDAFMELLRAEGARAEQSPLAGKGEG
ncbi:MAG TPA: ABC transporter ATP-binding protein [Anaerolineales bacterium]|nr:ABC transporter ATP-binding protein [Anaerolineales bacterium]